MLFSRIFGEGEALIILHGLFGMGDNWISLAKKYAENFKVFVVDQRNHGQSFHSDDWDYHFMVDDLEEFMDFHKIEKANILGHSMGGKTAMHFACMHPNRVNKLIVADIAPKEYPIHHHEIIKALKSVDFEKVNNRKEVEAVLSESIKIFSIRQFLMKNLHWIEKGKLAFRFNLNVIDKNLAKVGEALPGNAFYDGPTLFLRGVNSNYILDEDADLIYLHFHNSKLIDISNAGHWLHAENPNDFYNESLEFLLED